MHEYIKHLPYTTFVSSAAYYTDIFTVEFWEKQSPGVTFAECIPKLLPPDISADALQGIKYVAGGVDKLEHELATNNLRRADFGLGPSPPGPIAQMMAPFVRPYFVTLLLDRLYWAYTYDPHQPLQISLHKHPDHETPPIPRITGAREYLELTPTKMDSHIAQYSGIWALLTADQVSWSRGPVGAVTSGGSQESGQGDGASDELVEMQDELLHHAATITQASKFASLSRTIQATSNICGLAASSLFLITVSGPTIRLVHLYC